MLRRSLESAGPEPGPKDLTKPTSEGLGVAKAFQMLLDRSADCEPWNQGTFGLSAGTLESLVSALHRFDFTAAVGRIA